MAEFDPSKTDYKLNISGEYLNTLDIEGFARMMKDPSYCYKFYWLEAIVQLILEGVTETNFDAVIDEMICSAWYSVREFHIHLSGLQLDGQVRDGLERAILALTALSDLPANASRVEIKNAIKEHNTTLRSAKVQLTKMVPYYALSSFFDDVQVTVEWSNKTRVVETIEFVNKERTLLPYTLGKSTGLNREIRFQKPWIYMIQDNAVSIRGWIRYEKLKWLQNINPEVPGLVYKLAPMGDKTRKLGDVRKLWEGILMFREVRDVFTNQPVITGKYDVDHFIPWSFVMNDELWNLMPMDSSLNSSKSNRLPKWDPFFIKFADNQFLMYQIIHEKEGIRKLFEACYRDNLHSIWAGQELYRDGNSKERFRNILEKNMKPTYDSAKRQGYEVWEKAIENY